MTSKSRMSFVYSLSGAFLYFAVDRRNTPITTIDRPVHKLILIFSDLEYSSVSPIVVSPNMVNKIPSIVNKSPIGIFISRFIAFYFTTSI